jgi:hypothetical protein
MRFAVAPPSLRPPDCPCPPPLPCARAADHVALLQPGATVVVRNSIVALRGTELVLRVDQVGARSGRWCGVREGRGGGGASVRAPPLAPTRAVPSARSSASCRRTPTA